MSALVRRFVKTAIVFLILGLIIGTYMLGRRELLGVWPSPYLISAHTHAVFVGFVMFMILGVALWIFPKPARDDRRYRESRIHLVYWLLLAGTLSRFIGEFTKAYSDVSLLGWMVLLGGLLQLGSILLYVWTMWGRIRSTTRHKPNRVSRTESGESR